METQKKEKKHGGPQKFKTNTSNEGSKLPHYVVRWKGIYLQLEPVKKSYYCCCVCEALHFTHEHVIK